MTDDADITMRVFGDVIVREHTAIGDGERIELNPDSDDLRFDVNGKTIEILTKAP